MNDKHKMLDKAFKIANDYFGEPISFDLDGTHVVGERYISTTAFTEDGGFMFLLIDTVTGDVCC